MIRDAGPGGDGAGLDTGVGGGRGAKPGTGGGGGAVEGAGLDEGRGGSGVRRVSILFDARPDGFREAGGGIGGFLPIGGGGLGFAWAISGSEFVLIGLRLSFRAATAGIAGAAPGGGRGGAAPGLGGGAALGLVGTFVGGGFLLELVSGSESYTFTPPPVFLSFGMPPANSPPSCGALSIPPWPDDCSLLLLALFAVGG